MNHPYNHSMQLPEFQISIKNPSFLCKRFWMFILLPLVLLAGTAQAQTQISNWNDLDDIRNNLGGNYILMNDLDENTAGYATVAGPPANSGEGFIPIGDNSNPFTGTLNGDGHMINSLHISRPTAAAEKDGEDAALFAVANGATITNIGLVNVSISAGDGGNGIDGNKGEDGHYVGFDAIDPEPGENGSHGGVGGNAAAFIAINNGSVIDQSFVVESDITSGSGGTGGAGGDGGSGRNGTGGGYSSVGADGGMGGNGGVGGMAGGLIAINDGDISGSYVNSTVITIGHGGNGGPGGNGGDGGNSHESGGDPNMDGGDGGNGGDGNNGGSGGGLAAESAGNVAETYVSDSTIITGTAGSGGSGGTGGPVGNGNYDAGNPVPGENGSDGNNGNEGSAGALLAANNGIVSNSYFDINPDNNIGTQLSTANMTGAAAEVNMAGFDFDNTWLARVYQENYPKLLWEVSTASVFGTITNSLNGNAVEGAQITLSPDDDADISAADGTYHFELEIGKSYEITASTSVDEDFVITSSTTFQADHNKNVDLTLSPEFTGEGTAANPFRVETAEDLQQMRYNLSANYELQGNIDATVTANWFEGKGFQPIGNSNNAFTGSFEGNDYDIDDLSINRSGESYVGLFGSTSGTIENVNLTNVNITGNDHVGGLAGYSSGHINTVSVKGIVTGTGLYSIVGGLVGQYASGQVGDSHTHVTVSGRRYTGGLLGQSNVSVSSSSASGDVTGEHYTGGLVGIIYSSNISNSHATGNVSGHDYTGGLAGYTTGFSITQSYATGNVSGNDRTGGLAGHCAMTAITLSYTTGNVSGNNNVGGLVGYSTGSFSETFAAGNVTGNEVIGGLVGYLPGGALESSYSLSRVEGTAGRIGGLIGRTPQNTTTSYAAGEVLSTGSESTVGAVIGEFGSGGNFGTSYFDGPLSGRYRGIGVSLGGLNPPPKGLQTSQMQGTAAQSNMGFDYSNTWETVVADVNGALADGYPILKNIDRQVQLDAQLSITSEVVIEGEAGWRMLSIPLSGQTVEHLADQNQIQGVQGLYNMENSEGVPTPNEQFDLNFYTGIDETTELNWTGPANSETVINRGEGFIWYFWNNDIWKSKELPFTLKAKLSGADQQQAKAPLTSSDPPGNPENPEQNEDITISYASYSTGDFILAGNPFTSPIDFNELVLTDVAAKFWIYDPATDIFVTYNAATQQGISQIAAWQGFIIQATGDNPEITYPATAQIEGDPTFYKEAENADTDHPRINLQIEGQELSDGNVSALFFEGGQPGADAGDMAKFYLPAMSGEALLLYFDATEDHHASYLTDDARPLSFDEPQQFNLNAFGNKPGNYTLSWNTTGWKDGWHARLFDEATGTRVDMTETNSYTFDLEQTENGYHSRFAMTVSDGKITEDILPETFALEQNFPNPFNPSTVISYQIPVNSDVKLEVFDMLGRRVATLVNERVEAGTHQQEFNASALASGVYVYRLQAGNQVLTRKLTLIK